MHILELILEMYHILQLIHVCQMYASYDYGNKNENFTPKIKKKNNPSILIYQKSSVQPTTEYIFFII